MQIQIPNNWTPRPYQLEALQAFEQGKRRISLKWHRRAGKDSFAMNLAAIQAHREIGTYWHLFPLQTQARRAIWHGIGADGVRFIDQAFPPAIRKTTREQEMMIELRCGSIYQMAGSDRYDALVGSNPRGVIFSEYALSDPQAWAYTRPIIRENGGWAAFISTLRGKNHMHRQHTMAENNPDWFASSRTVDDTTRHDGTPVLTPEDIEAERREGMSEAMIAQEYYNSPMAAFEGSYWASAMLAMHEAGRICRVPYTSGLPVKAGFDLGMDDQMAAVFIQELGAEVRLIDAKTWRFKDIPQVCKDMQALPHNPQHLYLPHDANVTGMNSGLTREAMFRRFGYKTTVVPSPPNTKGADIEAGRQLLAQTWIDENCEEVIDAFNGYRTDPGTKHSDTFQKQPAHTWESHLADSWMCYAKGRREQLAPNKPIDYSRLRRGVI